MGATRFERTNSLVELQRMTARLIPHLDWRCNGLGVLQGYVSEGAREETRVHIWHPSLEREGIQHSGKLHDHRFNLHSIVLFGTIKHTEYSLSAHAEGEFQLFPVVHARQAMRENKTFNGAITADAQRYQVMKSDFTFPTGTAYAFRKRAFHGTNVEGLCVTLVSKSEQDDTPARILAPTGSTPVHAFADPMPRKIWAPYLDLAISALTLEA